MASDRHHEALAELRSTNEALQAENRSLMQGRAAHAEDLSRLQSELAAKQAAERVRLDELHAEAVKRLSDRHDAALEQMARANQALTHENRTLQAQRISQLEEMGRLQADEETMRATRQQQLAELRQMRIDDQAEAARERARLEADHRASLASEQERHLSAVAELNRRVEELLREKLEPAHKKVKRAVDEDPSVPECMQFSSTDGYGLARCMRGRNCPFRHVRTEAMELAL